jgi:hypothetical protein
MPKTCIIRDKICVWATLSNYQEIYLIVPDFVIIMSKGMSTLVLFYCSSMVGFDFKNLN